MQANKIYSDKDKPELQDTDGENSGQSKSISGENSKSLHFGLKTRVGKYECIYSPKISNQIVTSILTECLNRKVRPSLPEESKNYQTITGRHPVEIIPYSLLNEKNTKIRTEAVVRKGQRGGLISKLNKNYFLGSPHSFPETTRMWQEFAVLNYLRRSGVWVVEPLFAAVHSPLPGFYNGYLATVRLPGSTNFLDSLIDSEDYLPAATICEYAFLAGREAGKALEVGVLHADLHLGNVMVCNRGVHLIDFDNAKWNRSVSDQGYLDNGKNQLLARWMRGVEKRITIPNVRTALIKSFEAGLKPKI